MYYALSPNNRYPYYFCKTYVLGGPGSSKSALVDNILDKECFHHVNVGTLLFEELKNPIVNNSILPRDKRRKGRQKLLSAWQNGELLDSVRKQQSYYLYIIKTYRYHYLFSWYLQLCSIYVGLCRRHLDTRNKGMS